MIDTQYGSSQSINARMAGACLIRVSHAITTGFMAVLLGLLTTQYGVSLLARFPVLVPIPRLGAMLP